MVRAPRFSSFSNCLAAAAMGAITLGFGLCHAQAELAEATPKATAPSPAAASKPVPPGTSLAKPAVAAPSSNAPNSAPAAAPAQSKANPASGAVTKSPATSLSSSTHNAAAAAKPAADGRLTFSFRYQPWPEVLDWFAQQAGLSLLMESPPPGTFNYTDTRSYSPTEALDVLNGVLLTKGFTLVRHGKMLVLVNLEDGVPPNLVPDIPLDQLDKVGEYELVRVLFPVWNMTPEQAAGEVQPLLGPQGKVITLPQAREIQVTETGGRLRTIRSIVNAVEQPDLGTAGMREFTLKYLSFEAAMPTIRQMLGIPAEAFTTPDGSVQITKSATGDKLLFRGTAQQAARLTEVLHLIDVPEAATGINGAPQLEVYSVSSADPDAVVKVLQTILHNDPNVVLTADKDAGHVIAFAPPPLQKTIKATIGQLQQEAKQVDVINLTNVDPQVAVLAINKLFGSQTDQPDPKAPRVDADITTRSLMVRGTSAQVEQIRNLLRKLGESDEDGTVASTKQEHVRLLPLTASQARAAMTQIEQIWPTVRQNRIRIVTPASAIPSYRPGDDSGDRSTTSAVQSPESTPANEDVITPSAGERSATPLDSDAAARIRELYQKLLNERATSSPQPSPPLPAPAKSPNKPATPSGANVQPPTDRAAEANIPSVFHLIADDVTSPAAKTTTKTSTSSASNGSQPHSTPGAPVVVAPGPGGTIIASDDLAALDQLEDLLNSVAGKASASGREYAVFYLKYTKAATAAEVLSAIFGGSSGGKDRGIIGDIANNALGDVGGGLMSDLLTGGGAGAASFTSGAVDIVPDTRLNALIVHAKASDLDTVEQLLKVLDQRSGPENVEAEAQARAIPVYTTSATEIAQIVQQVYQDRMAGAAGVMSPQDMMKMIRGGNNAEQQVQKMSIAVDTRNNLLIVRAPDALFEEVKALVADLDHPVGDSPETTKVVSLKHTNSAAVQKALTSILSNVKTGTTQRHVHSNRELQQRRGFT